MRTPRKIAVTAAAFALTGALAACGDDNDTDTTTGGGVGTTTGTTGDPLAPEGGEGELEGGTTGDLEGGTTG